MRRRRPYLPGAFFHLTARTQGKVPWFEPAIVKDAVVRSISLAQEATDSEIIAFIVMDNHLHVVLRQWRAPVWKFMQSLLRRCALLVHRRYGVEGHVWERRYRDRVCSDANHMRTWVRYVHRNAIEAGRCTDVADWKWSSHHEWIGRKAVEGRPLVHPLPELFACSEGDSAEQCIAAYTDFVSASKPYPLPVLGMVPYRRGDAFFTSLGSVIDVSHRNYQPEFKRPDLRDVILKKLRKIAPDLNLQLVRYGRGAPLSKIRAQLITTASGAGYRGVEIARYLRVSESQVSLVLRSNRRVSQDQEAGSDIGG